MPWHMVADFHTSDLDPAESWQALQAVQAAASLLLCMPPCAGDDIAGGATQHSLLAMRCQHSTADGLVLLVCVSDGVQLAFRHIKDAKRSKKDLTTEAQIFVLSLLTTACN